MLFGAEEHDRPFDSEEEAGGFRQVLEKLESYRDSLCTIEDWLDGAEPCRLAIAVGPADYSDTRRAPVSLQNLDHLIAHEHS